MPGSTELIVLPKTPFKHHEAIIKELTEDLKRVYIDGKPLEQNAAEEKADLLCAWLCSTPSSIAYRVNTSVAVAAEVARFIRENFQLRPPPRMRIFQSPDLLIVDGWDEKVELDLNIRPDEVIVDASCGCSVLRGAHVFAPGVLGMPHGLKIGSGVSVYSDVSGNCKRGTKIYNDPGKVFLGNGTILQTRRDLFGEGVVPSGIAVRISDARSRLPQLSDSSVIKGHAILQNPPSIICSRILDPQPGDKILDLCAAPGNKTTHISSLMNGEGRLVALEKIKSKIQRLRANCELFDCKNVEIYCADSTTAVCSIDDSERTSIGPPFLDESFDRILLDGPCSALGQRPQILNRITPKELRSYVPLQRKLFTAAVKLLKTGGVLVYSTCTVTIAENEGIVAWALKSFPCLKLSSPKILLESMGLDDEYRGSHGYSIDGLDDDQSCHLLRFGSESNTVGFFISRFVKTFSHLNS